MEKEKLKRVKEIQEKIFELEEELKSIYNLQTKPEGERIEIDEDTDGDDKNV